mgnify:CR=1 FL=1
MYKRDKIILFSTVEPITAAILFLVSIMTAAISTSTGMGGGVIFFMLLLHYYPLGKTIPIHGFVQMFANILRTYVLRAHLVWEMCLPFLVGAVLGVGSIMWVLDSFRSKVIPYTIILLLLIYSVFKPQKLPEIKIPLKAFGFVGYVTGFLGIIVGAVDPILAPFFVREDFSKEVLVANKSFMQSVIHLAKLPVFLQLGFQYTEHMLLLGILLLGSAIGTYVGVWLLEKINRKIFMIVFKSILFVLACRIAYQLYKLAI